MLRLLLILLALAATSFAQTREDKTYYYNKTVTMSGSDVTITAYSPSLPYGVKVNYWIIRCTSTCVTELYRAGTIPTTSFELASFETNIQSASGLRFYPASDSTGGVLQRRFSFPQDVDMVIRVLSPKISAFDGIMSLKIKGFTGTAEVTAVYEHLN